MRTTSVRTYYSSNDLDNSVPQIITITIVIFMVATISPNYFIFIDGNAYYVLHLAVCLIHMMKIWHLPIRYAMAHAYQAHFSLQLLPFFALISLMLQIIYFVYFKDVKVKNGMNINDIFSDKALLGHVRLTAQTAATMVFASTLPNNQLYNTVRIYEEFCLSLANNK